MLLQVIEMTAWALLAAAATRASWHRPEAVIGLSLLLCSVITSAAYFGGSLGSRLVLEVGQAMCVTQTARIAFNARPSWANAAVVLLAVVDTAIAGSLSIALATGGIAAKAGSMYLGWGANTVFFLQCLCVGGVGVVDAVRDGRRRRGAGGGVDAAAGAQHAGRDAGAPQ